MIGAVGPRPGPELDPGEFLRGARHRFAAARRAGPGTDLDLMVAGRRVRIRFAGALADQLAATLIPLRAPPGDGVDLLLEAWDAASTGVSLPPRPWRDEDHLAQGRIRGLDGGRYRATFEPFASMLSVLDLEASTGIFWTADGRGVPLHVRASPFRDLLHWWAGGRGLQLVHAAGVATEHGAALLVGPSGSGKSTSALSCLAAGLRFLGDDLVLLEPGEPRVFTLFPAGKLVPEHLDRMTHLGRLGWVARRDSEEKAVLVAPGPAPSARLRAVVVPRVTRGPAGLHPIPRAEALRALAPSTLFQLPGPEPEAFQRMAAACRSVPAFRLELGPDMAPVPDLLRELLASLGEGRGQA